LSLDPKADDPAAQGDTQLWHGLLLLTRGVSLFEDTGLLDFLVRLRELGGVLEANGDRLAIRVPASVDSAELAEGLGENRELLTKLLRSAADGGMGA